MKRKAIVSIFCMLTILANSIFADFSAVFAEGEAEAEAEAQQTVWAYESFTYNGTDGIAVTEYTGMASDIFIPAKLDGRQVLKVGDGLFKDKSGINSVSLGEGIKVIGESAFENSTDLVCIVTPKTLTEIGSNAFSGCSAFNSIVLYSAVTSIGSGAFSGCGNVKIYGAEDSAAQAYADENNLTFVVISQNATPETVTQDGITYYIKNGEAAAVSIGNVPYSLVIPATVNGYPVTDLGEVFRGYKRVSSITIGENVKSVGVDAFRDCAMNKVIIPDNVTSIGERAFYNCDYLRSVRLPEGITSISKNTFAYCENLLTIDIPDSVQIIGEWAFDICTKMKSVTGCEGVRQIDRCAFSYCKDLTDISLPDSVQSIGEQTFYNCSSLQNIVIPKEVTSINRFTFASCPKLTSVIIPDNVRSIGDNAFYYCTSLKTVILGNKITSIYSESFGNCTSLQSILLPTSLTSLRTNSFPTNTVLCVYKDSTAHKIAAANDMLYYVTENGESPEMTTQDGITYCITNNKAAVISVDTSISAVTIPETVNNYPVTRFGEAFRNNENIKEITIGNNVTSIKPYAFFSCTGLKSIVLGESVTSIGTYAFSNCTSLSSITFGNNIKSIDNCAFTSCSSLTSITIPDSVTSFGYEIFRDCKKLKSVKLPANITEIRSEMFKNCESLTNITLPDTVTKLNYHVFYGCTSLTEAVIPSKVTEIPSDAYQNCTALKSVTIHENVTSIGYRTFLGCSSLLTVVIPRSVTSLQTDSFPTETVLCVYEDSYAHQFAVENNMLYYVTQNGEMPEFITQDGITYYLANGKASIVSVDTTLKTVEIPKEVNGCPVTALGEAFKNNTTLTSVSIPDSITNIEAYAFYKCNNLKTVTFPDNITSIGEYAFYECYRFSNINIPDKVKTIGKYAFYNCSPTSITIPDSVTSIGEQAFRYCTDLTSLTIGEGVTDIGAFAFYWCEKLSNLKIGSSVTSIGADAFFWCQRLTSVKIPDSVTSIGEGAFFNCINLTSITLGSGMQCIDAKAFSGCSKIERTIVPASVTRFCTDSFPANTILCVCENSYAHTFAKNNNLLYFVIHKTENSEISYGMDISGKVTYSDGTPLQNAAVSIYYDDGTLKESVVTDSSGSYSLTYAEVGAYTICASDEEGRSGSTQVSVKRMNAFDVFLAGETSITVKNSYTVSGTSSSGAKITLSEYDGRIIASTNADEEGAFTFTNIPNGTYTIKAENDLGAYAKEITVYNADLDAGELKISDNEEFASIVGTVSIEGREQNHYKRSWVQMTLYNSEGTAIAQTKTDKDGNYEFAKLPLDEYSIVAEASELRCDPAHGYDRSYTLTGYAYVNAAEPKQYTAEEIVLTEENNNLCEISGIVYADKKPTASSVILKNVFRCEIARCRTDASGKYTFKNVRDGLYFIFAVTDDYGMGFTVVTVRRGRVFGRTDISVFKHEKIREQERKMGEIPHCSDRNEAIKYRDEIRMRKKFYDGLSEKEKLQFSPAYVERLNRLCEWITDFDCEENGGRLSYGGMLASEDELGSEDAKIELVLTVSETQAHKISSDGIKTEADFCQQGIDDAMGAKTPVKYYDITLTKNGTKITDISKQTNSTGKLRITLEIPEEYRGHKNYSFVHMHNGIATTLVDLDDDPNTVTFEIDRFSTFALAYTDEELTDTGSDDVITYSNGKITVKAKEDATLYIAKYTGNTLTTVEDFKVKANEEQSFDFDISQTAFLWKNDMVPLCKKFNAAQ